MDINKIAGEKIRMLRNANHLSLDDLAKMIHKSKSSLSKYEQGEINIDLETLDEIACALHVSIHSLLPGAKSNDFISDDKPAKLFFSQNDYTRQHSLTNQIFVYFFGGVKDSLRMALLEINESNNETCMYIDPYLKNKSIGCSFFYSGKTTSFDSKYRMVLHNCRNENDIFIIQWVDNLSDISTIIGLLSYFATGPFQSFSTKCLLSKYKLPMDDTLSTVLSFSKDEIKNIKKRNALYNTDLPQAYEIMINSKEHSQQL